MSELGTTCLSNSQHSRASQIPNQPLLVRCILVSQSGLHKEPLHIEGGSLKRTGTYMHMDWIHTHICVCVHADTVTHMNTDGHAHSHACTHTLVNIKLLKEGILPNSFSRADTLDKTNHRLLALVMIVRITLNKGRVHWTQWHINQSLGLLLQDSPFSFILLLSVITTPSDKFHMF